jgi:hypothetical protein
LRTSTRASGIGDSVAKTQARRGLRAPRNRCDSGPWWEWRGRKTGPSSSNSCLHRQITAVERLVDSPGAGIISPGRWSIPCRHVSAAAPVDARHGKKPGEETAQGTSFSSSQS